MLYSLYKKEVSFFYTMEGRLISKNYKVWRLRITSTYSTHHHTNTDDTCSSCVQHDAHDHAWLNWLVYFSPSEVVNKLGWFKPG